MPVQYTPFLVFAVFAPILGGIVVLCLYKQNPIRKALVPIITSAISVSLLASLIPAALSGQIVSGPNLVFSSDMALSLRADTLGLYFAFISSFIWLLASVFSQKYLENTEHSTRYFSLFSSCLGFTLGIALAGNLFTIFIFYELLTISSYPLIAHEETPAAKQAAKKYIIYTLLGDAMVLFTILLVYYLAGNLLLHQRGLIPIDVSRTTVKLLLICGMLGFGVKSAIMPLHGWVADAHPAAPAPASAVLSGVLVNVGAYGIIRLVYDIIGVDLMTRFGLSNLLAIPAMVTIVFASILAFNQDNLKRRLAYSTVAQMSYILLGIAFINQVALKGSLVHLAHHGIMKATLFLCAGAIIKYTGNEKISQMQGLGRKMPIVMSLFSLVALSLIGVPPLCGFISKWMLCTGALQVSNITGVVALLLGSLFSALYLLPVIYTAFFQKDGTALVAPKPIQVSKSILIPLFIGALLCIVMGIAGELFALPHSFANVISAAFFGS